MSTKSIRKLLEDYPHVCASRNSAFGDSDLDAEESAMHKAALAEVEAIEKAAKDMTRLYAGDFVYNIREYEHVLNAPGDSWHHPDVKAWSDAAVLLSTIAKEAK